MAHALLAGLHATLLVALAGIKALKAIRNPLSLTKSTTSSTGHTQQAMSLWEHLPDEATTSHTHLLHEISSPLAQEESNPIDPCNKRLEAYGDLATRPDIFQEKKRPNLTRE